jgi:TonB-linked SusC/RagA family outer membrane protein
LNLSGNTRLDYRPFKGFKASMIASYVQTTGRQTIFRSTQRINSTITLGPNSIKEFNNNNYYYTLQGLGEYNKQFGKNQINILAGYSFEKNTADNFNAYRDNLPGNELAVLNVGSPGNQQSAGTGAVYALESQFARANYAYNNKYLVEGVIRRDGSSRFPTDKKYAYFPSVAVGWRIGQESFIKDNLPWIDELKIKASRGVLGNQNLGNNYPYQNILSTSSNTNGGSAATGVNVVGGTLYSFGGTIAQGVTRDQLTDATLHWESTRTTDVGLEAAMFKNKLNFSVTYFDRYTYDILYSPTSISKVLGFDVSALNSGKLKNNGFEFTLSHNNKIGKFSYNVGGNFTILNNKVLDLGVGNIVQPNGLVGNGTDLFVGYPGSTGQFALYYGFIADGLFADQAAIAAWPNQTAVTSVPKPGDIRYRDISGPNGVPDGKVDNTYDRVILGSQIPKYSYGINLGANILGFDFSALLQGIAGVKGYLSGDQGFALNNTGNVQRWQYEGRFNTENPNPNAVYPRMEQISNSGTANSVVSSFWTINGAYLRIKNVQVGYTLPKLVSDKVNVSKVRIYVSGENLHTYSNYRKGWDPEVNTGSAFYPIIANYTLGLNVTF